LAGAIHRKVVAVASGDFGNDWSALSNPSAAFSYSGRAFSSASMIACVLGAILSWPVAVVAKESTPKRQYAIAIRLGIDAPGWISTRCLEFTRESLTEPFRELIWGFAEAIPGEADGWQSPVERTDAVCNEYASRRNGGQRHLHNHAHAWQDSGGIDSSA
jgi:hypothetical protein